VKRVIELKVNGEKYELAVEPQRTLLEVLRENLGLTGTKKACGTGECGACTVMIHGRAVLACLTLALEAQGTDVLTIEGLAQGEELHPLQRAFVNHGAIQCGYCTPGFIMTAKAFLVENPKPTPDEVRKAIGGNLCRCTGYAKVVDAIVAASEEMRAVSP